MVHADKVLVCWLDQQCRMIPGAVQAVLLTGPPGKGPYEVPLYWPDHVSDQGTLSPIAHAALHNQQAVLKSRNSVNPKTGEPLDALACPLYAQEGLIGVVAVEIVHRAELMQRTAVQQLQAGAQWLELMLRLRDEDTREQLLSLLNLVAAALEQDRFRGAATEVANILAHRFGCSQVSLGFMHRSRVQVTTISHTNRIDPHANLVEAIRDAMGEALDQGARIVVPPPDGSDPAQATRFHAQLAEMRQGATVCTLPLVKNGKAIGAMLMERTGNVPFSAETLTRCEQIGLLLGPVLEARRREERSLPAQIFEKLQEWGEKLFGPGHPGLKGGAVLATVLLVSLLLANGTMRIPCESALEADTCRVIAAPQQGYIARAPVRAGDLVRKGDLLATLDDRELLLEQRKWQSQRAQLLKESRKALAGLDRAEVAILNAKLAQAEAELQLIEQRLERTTLIAPFAGLVVKGDLSQSLGSPVASGDVLFEISPTDHYRVVIKVDDRDIGLVAPGQKGQLKLSSIPEQTIPITIERLTPVSLAEKGRNFFRVEATMQWHSDLMRPGMEGIAKIETGKAKLLWIWSRRLVDWLRLFAWNHVP